MWFEGRLISELTADDIRGLIGKNEDEGIDFKSEPYGGPTPSADKKFELCCDVAAFANADGGYIVIGIDDDNDIAVALCPIPEPKLFMEQLYKTCFDGIEPRIEGLDVGAVDLGTSGSVIVIRVPQRVDLPHMVRANHSTHFCCRYKDGKREMSYGDIRGAFQGDLTQHRLTEISGKVDTLSGLLRGGAMQSALALGADDNLLLAQTPENAQAIMEERLERLAQQ